MARLRHLLSRTANHHFLWGNQPLSLHSPSWWSQRSHPFLLQSLKTSPFALNKIRPPLCSYPPRIIRTSTLKTPHRDYLRHQNHTLFNRGTWGRNLKPNQLPHHQLTLATRLHPHRPYQSLTTYKLNRLHHSLQALNHQWQAVDQTKTSNSAYREAMSQLTIGLIKHNYAQIHHARDRLITLGYSSHTIDNLEFNLELDLIEQQKLPL